MTVAVVEYTPETAHLMASDYAARRARLYAPRVDVAPAPVLAPALRPALPPPRASLLAFTMYSKWSDEDKATLRAMAKEGRYVGPIAKALGRSVGGVQKVASTLGIKIKRAASLPDVVKKLPDFTKLADEREAKELPDRQTAKAIIAHISQELDVSVPLLFGECRGAFTVAARHQAIWLIARDTGLSMSSIGRMFNRDHTTILSAIRKQNRIREANVRRVGTGS